MSDARTMLITGTRTGIGRHLAEEYLRHGWNVVGCSRGHTDLQHPKYLHTCLDVKDEPEVKRLLADLRKRFDRLDVLINNAGVAAMNHTLLTPVETLDRVFATNVTGTFLFCRESAKLMQRTGGGRIVNFSTVAVPLNLEGEAIYAASKAAVVALTRILARELAPHGITVNAVGPTPIETDLIRSVPPKKIEALIQRQAIPRLGEPRDVANVIDFFIRPESDFVTGQVLYLGGV